MPMVTDQQGVTQGVPPIPKMDVGTPGTPSAAQIRQQARALAVEVRQAAREAVSRADRAAALPVIAGAQGGAGGAAPPAQPVLPGSTIQRPSSDDVIPQQAVDISLAFFGTMAVIIILFPFSRAMARLIDRRSQQPAMRAPDVTPQLRQLQESVDALAIEMERISEAQRFTSKLLAERAEVAKQP